MGMDVYGRVPKNDEGKCFRANCWSWRPLCRIMWESSASSLLDDQTWASMAFNSGAGPQTAEIAEEMAERIEEWILIEDCCDLGWEIYEPRQSADGKDDIKVDEEGKFVGEDYEGLTHSAYRIHRDHVKEFVDFLKNCGGFEVW